MLTNGEDWYTFYLDHLSKNVTVVKIKIEHWNSLWKFLMNPVITFKNECQILYKVSIIEWA